jgi:hypothetical protein
VEVIGYQVSVDGFSIAAGSNSAGTSAVGFQVSVMVLVARSGKFSMTTSPGRAMPATVLSERERRIFTRLLIVSL